MGLRAGAFVLWLEMSEVVIIKSPCDKKLYRKVDLPNGLQCLLIHDPEIGTGAGLDEEDVWPSPLSKKWRNVLSKTDNIGQFLEP